MRRTICTLGLTALVVAFFWVLGAPQAAAFETYHGIGTDDQGNCADCHGDFRGSGDNLHNVHVSPFTSNCNLCHTGVNRENPFIMWSGGDGVNQNTRYGCVGCHGRDYGETIQLPDGYNNGGGIFNLQGLPKMSGFGLRLRHLNAGETLCLECHDNDQEPRPEGPDDGTAPETQPPYYARTDVTVTGTCNADGSEDSPATELTNDDPPGSGLDNDGDLLYDLNDPDCVNLCGNGVVDAGEDCDGTVCCAADCSFEPSGTACDDGFFCTVSDICDGAGTCDGPPTDCSDGVGCTDDACNEATDSCMNTPNDAACDDGLFCTGAETCDPVADCQSAGDPCASGTICNEETDTCDPVGCTSDAECDDGLYCNGAETCDTGSGDCLPGTPVDCNDGVGCTVDSCNEATDSCDNAADDAACDDGLFCTGAEICDPVADCQSAGDPCPAGTTCNDETDTCDPIGCTSDAECDDGLFCNGAETCDTGSGECLSGTPVDCSDGVSCTVDSCNEATDSCDNPPDDAACDDGLFCNGAETCDPVADCQAGTPVDCSDGVGCTVDSCNETTDSCDNAPDDAACDDGLYCNGAETCDPVADCQAGSPPCDPATETCNEDTDTCEPIGCTSDADCDDGLFCNGVESCDTATGQCFAVSACPPAIDGCVTRGFECDEENDVCIDFADDSLCDDGLYCNGAETCDIVTGACLAGTPVDCSDGVGCTVDSCNETTDSCDNVADDSFCPDDGLFCNGAEFCDPVNDCQSTGDPCGAGEACNEEIDVCEPVGEAVDLDIFKFSASKRVLIGPPGQKVKIKLWVSNGGAFDGMAAATVVGMQNGAVVYSETMMVSDLIDYEPTLYKFPSYTAMALGEISWMATIADDDPDDDVATATTVVVP